MKKYSIKIRNEWIENTADLFSEWFDYKGGYQKGILQFLADEKLDKLFSVKDFMGLMTGEVRVPLMFAAPMARACPFELSLKEAADLITTSKFCFRFGHDIEMDRKEVAAFHSTFMSAAELEKLKKEEYILAYDLENLSPGCVPKVRSEDEEIHFKHDRMMNTGVDEASVSDEEVRVYIKPRTDLSKEQRRANRKRKNLECRGLKVKDLSDEEIMVDHRFIGRRSNQEVWIDKKRKVLIAEGVEKASTMTDEEIKQYSGKYKLDRCYSDNLKLYQKKRTLDGKKVDYEYWTDQEILDFDERKKGAREAMEAIVLDRRGKGIEIQKLKKIVEIKRNKEKTRRAFRLEVADAIKFGVSSGRTKRYYQTQMVKKGKRAAGIMADKEAER